MIHQILDIHQCAQCNKIVYNKKIMIVYPQWVLRHFCSDKCKEKFRIENKVDNEFNIRKSEFEINKITTEDKEEALHV